MIILNPISLPASKMLTTMTAFVNDIRFTENIQVTDIVTDLVDSCRIGQVDYGKGIVRNFPLDVLPVNDLSETSSAFTIKKANVAQETILIDKYKVIQLSTSKTLVKDAVPYGEAINTFFGWINSLIETTRMHYMYDEVNKMIQDWTPTKASQTIAIDQIDTSSLKGMDLNQALIWNANNIAKTIRKVMNNMKVLSDKFSDVENYTDINGGGQKKVKTAISTENIKLIMNDKYETEFIANSLASLFHAEKVGDMYPAGKLILIPTDSMSSANEKTIGWLSSKEKFAFADFYKVAMSITDPSTTYENMFLHFAYGKGVFSYDLGVKFVENTIQPAQVQSLQNT